MYETIDYDVAGTTAIVTLDRPDALNTIVPPMLEELDAAVTAAIRDRAVKVILLQGAGSSFCAGSTSPAASPTGTTRSPATGATTRGATSSWSPRTRPAGCRG
jgi:enoyl-CoA hydratase/carnithine racemase